jgi:hypothetical protein
MADYDMSQYDANYPSINQYINLLAEFNIRLTNMNSNKIMLQTRKTNAFEALSQEVSKLEGEELQKWKDKLEIVFKPDKAKAKKAEQLQGYNEGEDVIYYTNYRHKYGEWGEMVSHEIPVKCMIIKINKSSITLAKFNCEIDYSEIDEAIRRQGAGRIKFKWTDSIRLYDTVVVRKLSDITRRCDNERYFQSHCKESHYYVDYGN